MKSAKTYRVLLSALLVALCFVARQGSPEQLSEREATALGTQLIDASIAGDVARIKRILLSGGDVNFQEASATNKGGATALHFAASRNHAAVVTLLLKSGARVNAKDIHGDTPLLWAAGSDADAAADVLLSSGANLTLHTAARLGKLQVIEGLLGKTLDVNLVDRHGQTALHLAAQRCAPAVADLLIRRGANPNASNKYGYTPLHDAATEGCASVAKILIKNGSKVNALTLGPTTVSVGGLPLPIGGAYSPLYLIGGKCENEFSKPREPNGDAEIAKVLIKNGADPNLGNKRGETLLHTAAQRNCIALTAALLAAGANANSCDVYGRTPLDEAGTDSRTVKTLVKYGAKRGCKK